MAGPALVLGRRHGLESVGAVGHRDQQRVPGPHALVDAAQAEELVGGVQLLVGRGEREEQRLRPDDLLEQGGGGERAGDDRQQDFLVGVDRAQGLGGGGDRRVGGVDAIGGHRSPVLLDGDAHAPGLETARRGGGPRRAPAAGPGRRPGGRRRTPGRCAGSRCSGRRLSPRSPPGSGAPTAVAGSSTRARRRSRGRRARRRTGRRRTAPRPAALAAARWAGSPRRRSRGRRPLRRGVCRLARIVASAWTGLATVPP